MTPRIYIYLTSAWSRLYTDTHRHTDTQTHRHTHTHTHSHSHTHTHTHTHKKPNTLIHTLSLPHTLTHRSLDFLARLKPFALSLSHSSACTFLSSVSLTHLSLSLSLLFHCLSTLFCPIKKKKPKNKMKDLYEELCV